MGTLSIDALVCHDDREDWGQGVVVSLGKYTTVFFRNAGEKKFTAVTSARLIPLAGHELPADDPLRSSRGRKALTSRRNLTASLSTLLNTFEEHFPEGFSDPKYLNEEDYKNDEIQRAREILSAAQVSTLVESEDWEELRVRLNRAVQKTNLIFSFEKMRLRDLSTAALPEIGRALQLITQSTSEVELGVAISRLADALRPDGANKWAVVSWLANLLSDLQPPFVKPTPVQTAGKALGFDIGYAPHPNARTWSRINEVYRLVKAGIEEHGLKPRDLFDVYTFLWFGSGLARKNEARNKA